MTGRRHHFPHAHIGQDRVDVSTVRLTMCNTIVAECAGREENRYVGALRPRLGGSEAPASIRPLHDERLPCGKGAAMVRGIIWT
ncbi:hypothetical protein Ssi03_20990 [Sphaerisporangium siamense]|nr:hypothetical protein Ssi03_20990 [Sphaerisporangium siamense]